MANLNYIAITSLDGYIEDRDGSFGWGEPSEEAHRFVNRLQQSASTYLYGRRMYETMMVWETDPGLAAESPVMGEFAEVWQAADKIVFSSTLAAPATSRTRIERTFDPQAIRRLKETLADDILVGGANLASQAFHAGLVDRYHLFVVPIALGGGKAALPTDLCLPLELLEEKRFDDGMVYLHYRILAG